MLSKTSKDNQLNLKTLSYKDLTWIDIIQPNREATKFLADNYDFNQLDLEDALSPQQVSKVEVYENYIFIVMQISVYDKVEKLSTKKQWSAFVGVNFLITLRPAELKVADELFGECDSRDESREQYMSQGSGYLLYQILDRAIDRYFKVLDKIYSKIEDIEDSVFKENIEAISQLTNLRRDIINQRQVMLPTRTTLVELEPKLKHFSNANLDLYFSDLMDHVNKICTILDEYTEVIEVFKDLDYLQSSYLANRTTRALTMIMAIFLPILVITAIYYILPQELGKGSFESFIALSVFAVILVGIILLFLRRRHLI